MFDDLHEIAENSAYLKAVEEKDVSTEIVERLPPYEELVELEKRLKEEGDLSFATVFHRPAGFYLFQSFLKADYSEAKGLFVRDVEAFKKMRFESARQRVALLIYDRYVRPSGDDGTAAPGTPADGAADSPGSKRLSAPKGTVFAALTERAVLPAAAAATAAAASEGEGEGGADPASVSGPARRSSHGSVSGSASEVVVSTTAGGGGSQGAAPVSMLNVGASNAIGVFGSALRRVTAAVEAGRSEATLFDGVLAAVLNDLQHDAFPRFLRSEQYRTYVRTTAASRRAVTLSDFQTFRVLGRGGFGSVHACRKADSGAMYAMKMINKRMCAKKKSLHHIMGEREVLKTVRGRHVTSLKYALQDKDNLVLVMDLCLGGDLKFHLSSSGRFKAERARFYAAEVVLGLDELHGRGIVYRDLKLENVLLDEAGHVRISDLGLAVRARGGPGAASVTGYAGTPGYAAPEVVRREAYGTAADLFSLGVLVYRMVSGKKPFKERQGETRDDAVLRDDPDLGDASFDDDCRDLLRGLMEKDASKRLGAGPGGLERVKAHPYFRGIDWGLLEAGYLEPPFVPNRYDVNAAPLRDIGDFDEDKLRGVVLDERFLEQAGQFDYVSEEALQDELAASLQKADEAAAAAAAAGGTGDKQGSAKGCCALM